MHDNARGRRYDTHIENAQKKNYVYILELENLLEKNILYGKRDNTYISDM